MQKGRDGVNEGKVIACTLTLDCSIATPQRALVNGLDSPTEMLVDSGGITWITAGKKIQKCEKRRAPAAPRTSCPPPFRACTTS